MRALAPFGLLATLALGGPTVADEPKGDLAKLQGGWTAKVGPQKDILIRVEVKGSVLEIKLPRPDGSDVTVRGEIKLDEKAEPKTVDWIKFQGPGGEPLPENLGIYKLDGDAWITCSGGPGNPRPSKFEEGEGGPPSMTTWTKVKDSADAKPIEGDLSKFQGSWLVPAGPNDEVLITMTVKGNAYTAKWDRGDGTNVELKGELRLNEKATPKKTVDFFNNQRNDGDDSRDNLGIYEFDGNTIRVCVGGPGNERPTELKKGEDGAQLLLIFSRKKD